MLLCLAACAKDTGVVSVGKEQYMVMRQGDGFWETAAALKAEALKEANLFCEKQGKATKVTRTDSEAAGLGKFPQAEVYFTCE